MKNPRLIDLTGKRFGRWLVMTQLGNTRGGAAIWQCKCDCGKTGKPTGIDLRSGKTISCGCFSKELLLNKITTHGHSGTRLHRIWKGMNSRCKCRTIDAYKRYGGKGISICAEWGAYENFNQWSITHGYADNLSIDRIDNSKGYTPENCRWADRFTQSKNRDFIKKREDGKPWFEVARENGISLNLFHGRVHEGWSQSDSATLQKGTILKKLKL